MWLCYNSKCQDSPLRCSPHWIVRHLVYTGDMPPLPRLNSAEPRCLHLLSILRNVSTNPTPAIPGLGKRLWTNRHPCHSRQGHHALLHCTDMCHCHQDSQTHGTAVFPSTAHIEWRFACKQSFPPKHNQSMSVSMMTSHNCCGLLMKPGNSPLKLNCHCNSSHCLMGS